MKAKKHKDVGKNISITASEAIHDIKNPLTSLTVLLQLLQREMKQYDNQKIDSYYERIHFQTQKIIDYLNQLSTYIKISTDSLPLNLEFIKIPDFLVEIGDSSQIKILGHGTIEIIADKRRLSEAIHSLIRIAQGNSKDTPRLEYSFDKKNFYLALDTNLNKNDIIEPLYWGKLSENGFLFPIAFSIFKAHGGSLILKNNKKGKQLICSLPVAILNP